MSQDPFGNGNCVTKRFARRRARHDNRVLALSDVAYCFGLMAIEPIDAEFSKTFGEFGRKWGIKVAEYRSMC